MLLLFFRNHTYGSGPLPLPDGITSLVAINYVDRAADSLEPLRTLTPLEGVRTVEPLP